MSFYQKEGQIFGDEEKCQVLLSKKSTGESIPDVIII